MESFCKKHGISVQESPEFGRGFYVANKGIKAGSIIWNESAISYALKPTVCHYCWKKAEQTEQSKLYQCGNCKFARYCSKSCQSSDWKSSHKIRCKSIAKLNGKTPTVTIAAVAEFLSNIQPLHSNTMTKLQHSLIPSLNHHFDRKSDAQKSDIHQVSLCIALYIKSIQTTLKIDMNQIHLTLCTFSTNAISICDDEFNTLGIGLFPLLSLINHSCDPNVMIKFNPRSKTAEIRALRALHPNEQLLINYTDVTVPKFMRQRALAKDYCFECKCRFCVRNNEQICIDLCCQKCGHVLGGNAADVYECLNATKCGEKYKKMKLREIVDKEEEKYYQIKKELKKIERIGASVKRNDLLKECRDCMSRIDGFVGRYHWLRISILKVMEKLQLSVNDFDGCYDSNQFILEFYEKWLSSYSPYLGIQYCLNGKLLNYLIHDKCVDVYGQQNDDGNSKQKQNELFDLCVVACQLFDKGLNIVRISHGETEFVRQLIADQQTAKFNLQNVNKQMHLI